MTEAPVTGDKWSGRIGGVRIGSGEREVVIGGSTGLPFLSFEGSGTRPLIAGEVLDDPEGAVAGAVAPFGGAVSDPVAWARMWAEEFKADIICLRLRSTSPEGRDAPIEDAVATVREVMNAVKVPLMVYGSGAEGKDAKLLEAVSAAFPGERVLLGHADDSSYKSVAAAAAAGRNAVVAFSNLDINLAKQMNILLTDYGIKLEDVVMDPLMAGLGMGLEYSYSVNERIRMAALMGDRMLQAPMLCDATSSWEAREATDEDARLGDAAERGAWWEATTALAALVSGADVVVLKSPRAAAIVREAIDGLGGE